MKQRKMAPKYFECCPRTKRHGRAYKRRMTRKKEKRRKWLIRKCSSTGGYIAWGWANGDYVEIGTYVQFSKNSNAQRYWKRQSNKKVRRYKEYIPHGCYYKRLFPYLWKIYNNEAGKPTVLTVGVCQWNDGNYKYPLDDSWRTDNFNSYRWGGHPIYQIWQSTTSIGAMHRMGVETSLRSSSQHYYLQTSKRNCRSTIWKQC